MRNLFIVAVLLLFVWVFVPDACSSEKRRSVVSPDRHEFLGFGEFVEKYGRPEERAWARGEDAKKRKKKKKKVVEQPMFYGY